MNSPSMVGRASANAPRQRRFGLMALIVGFAAIRKDDDGKEASFTAKAKRLYPEAKCVATCVTCGKDYPTMQKAESAHPDLKIMTRRQESHVLAFWSDDIDPKSEAAHATWERTRQLAKETGQAFNDPEPAILPIGYLSEVE